MARFGLGVSFMMKGSAQILRSIAQLARRLLERTLRFGPADLRRTTPLHPGFGFRRGTPVDRYYIERFLTRHADLLNGDGLEVGDDRYLSRYGAARLRTITTLQLAGEGPGRLVGDLTRPATLPKDLFDCFICTQTMNFIYDVQVAMQSCYRLLKPGGCLLLTVAGTSQISRHDADRWGDFWRFTPHSITRLALEEFSDVSVSAWGNVLAATALFHGLVAEELSTSELDVQDPDYPVVISLLGRKL